MSDNMISIPKGDYRAIPFAMKVSGVVQDISGWTFVWTAKRKVTDLDDKIVFEIVIEIPSGTPAYSGLLEFSNDDGEGETPKLITGNPVGKYWIECSAYNDVTKPVTGKPMVFEITERERKEMPV